MLTRELQINLTRVADEAESKCQNIRNLQLKEVFCLGVSSLSVDFILYIYIYIPHLEILVMLTILYGLTPSQSYYSVVPLLVQSEQITLWFRKTVCNTVCEKNWNLIFCWKINYKTKHCLVSIASRHVSRKTVHWIMFEEITNWKTNMIFLSCIDNDNVICITASCTIKKMIYLPYQSTNIVIVTLHNQYEIGVF